MSTRKVWIELTEDEFWAAKQLAAQVRRTLVEQLHAIITVELQANGLVQVPVTITKLPDSDPQAYEEWLKKSPFYSTKDKAPQ